MDRVIIYTDGACKGNPGEGGWGAVLVNGDRTLEISGYEPLTTNNRMEILAAVMALSKLKKPCHVNLYTDSAYLKSAVSEKWIEKWKMNGWQTSNKKSVKNQDLWLQLDEFLHMHQVSFLKVKGHSGDPLNERCDALANEAIIKKSSSS